MSKRNEVARSLEVGVIVVFALSCGVALVMLLDALIRWIL